MSSSIPLHGYSPGSVTLVPLAMAGQGGDPDDTPPDVDSGGSTTPRDDLPYRVELWNQDGTAVEQVLAVTADSSIGYAAYHAAAREYPDRYLTLRHQNRILSRWNPRQ